MQQPALQVEHPPDLVGVLLIPGPGLGLTQRCHASHLQPDVVWQTLEVLRGLEARLAIQLLSFTAKLEGLEKSPRTWVPPTSPSLR